MSDNVINLTDYWATYYIHNGHCSLCGNSGEIDTRETAVTAAGVRSGRINLCICPNGQARRLRCRPEENK